MNEEGSAAGVSLAVIAIIVSVIALVLGWIAYNRTGADLEDRIQQGVNEAAQSVQENTQEGANEVEQETQETTNEAEQESDEVRQDASDAIEPNDSTTN